jgi:hypothetical protein
VAGKKKDDESKSPSKRPRPERPQPGQTESLAQWQQRMKKRRGGK